MRTADARLLQQLQSVVGPAGMVDSPDAMAPYLHDNRDLYRGRAALILRPAATAEVADLLALCNAAGVAVVPHGGNTGYCGGAQPDASGEQLVLSLGRMNRVRAVEPDNDCMTVEAGCILASVQQAADAADRYFPLSLAAEGSCQIGGNLSTNAGGTAVLRYGMARDLVLGLEVVLADGRVLSTLGCVRKDNSGYDLNALFVGAEGTLGVITAATLKLFPKPASSATALVAVISLDAAIDLLAAVRAASADRVSGCEIMARSALELVLRHVPGTRDPFAAQSPWYLLLELQGSAAGVALQTVLAAALEAAAASGQVSDAVIAASGAQRRALWKLRESISGALARQGAHIKHDVSVPIAALPAFAADAGPWILARVPGARLVPFGHLGDGNLHYNVSLPASTDRSALQAAAGDIERGVHDIARRHGGSFSAEHGIGQYKVGELQRLADPVELALMRSLKRALDPNNIMNPGKVLGTCA